MSNEKYTAARYSFLGESLIFRTKEWRETEVEVPKLNPALCGLLERAIEAAKNAAPHEVGEAWVELGDGEQCSVWR